MIAKMSHYKINEGNDNQATVICYNLKLPIMTGSKVQFEGETLIEKRVNNEEGEH